MPAGIEAVVEDGFATIDFVDRSLQGPALAALAAMGSKVTKETRVGPRARYHMPEGDAIAAGLIDGETVMPEHLAYGDSGFAEDLQSVGNAGARPTQPTSRNMYVGATPAADVMAIPGPSTTVDGSIPTDRIVTPIHGSVKKYCDYSLPQPHEPGDCTHPGDGSGVATDGVIDYVEPTRVHSPAPQRPTKTSHITIDTPAQIPGSGIETTTPGGGSNHVEPGGSAPAPEPVAVPAPAEVPTAEWTNAEIKAYADANGIDLGGATKKSDMLAAIEAAG